MSKIVGLHDVKKGDDKDKDKKRQEFFAGGIDQRGGGSGLAVVGPPRRDNTPFGGVIERAMMDTNEPPPGTHSADATSVAITLYRNGFTVDNGPLRNASSPENKEFISSLEKGEIPIELRATHRRLDVQLVDKREEEYVAPPPPAYVAFSGLGGSLRSATTATESDAFVFSADILSDVAPIVLDNTQPTTTIQIKTPTGKPLRLKINHSHTVLQVAAHISSVSAASASASNNNFVLMSGFPPIEIVDPTQTIAEANLLGASISQKFI